MSVSEFDYDLFVIGGGSGGVRAARVAASTGARVGVAEQYRYGGTCVIRGCVPKKLMVYASHFHEAFEDAAGFGWQVGEATFDWSTLIANKDREIGRLEGLYRKGVVGAGGEVFDTRAELAGPNSVRLLAQDRVVTAARILVATGGTPSRLAGLPGGEHAITSDDIFHLERQPDSIAIFGGGYIAVEFACILAGLGTKTTLVYRGEEILRGFDNDLRAGLHREMAKKGIEVVCGHTPTSIGLLSDGRREVTLSDARTLAVDHAMLAVGRRPQTDGLGLETAGVEVAASGHIKVDEFSKTTADAVWAVGDVTDRVALTPVAIHEAMCFVETEFKSNPTRPDHELIPTAVFSQPQIGTVGLTEAQAAEHYAELEVYLTEFSPMVHTLSGRDEKTVMKIIVDGASRRVVGVHVLSPDGGELAQTLGIALKSGATKDDFDRTMAVHPTAAEELVTMYAPSYRVRDGKRVD